jgi:hypothetical protein
MLIIQPRKHQQRTSMDSHHSSSYKRESDKEIVIDAEFEEIK